MWEKEHRNNQRTGKTFANPKSESLTDPFASTNIFAHLISLKYIKKKKYFSVTKQEFNINNTKQQEIEK